MQGAFSSREWIKRIQDNCETTGVSRQIIERFINFYMEDGRGKNAKPITSSSRSGYPSK